MRQSGDRIKRVLLLTLAFLGLAALLLLYVTAADHTPWPVYGMAGFIWGAGLVAVATGYAHHIRRDLSPSAVKWGIVLAIAAYFLIIILNQLINSHYLHTNHKLLAFIAAFYVFVTWITALKSHTGSRSSTG